METLIKKLVEADKVPASFLENVDEITALVAQGLEKHSEDYEIALGLKEREAAPTTRKLYAIHYKVLSSEINPEAVNGRTINFGCEGTNVIDATMYFLENILQKGTEVDIVKVELEQTFETGEDISANNQVTEHIE